MGARHFLELAFKQIGQFIEQGVVSSHLTARALRCAALKICLDWSKLEAPTTAVQMLERGSESGSMNGRYRPSMV